MQQPQTDRRLSRALLGLEGEKGRGKTGAGRAGRSRGDSSPAPAAGSHAPLSAGNLGPRNGIQEAEILQEPATVLYRFVEKPSL